MGTWTPGPGATSGDDTFEGDLFDPGEGVIPINDVADGLEGDDHLSGRGGNDTLSGSGGDDILVGDEGADTLDGGNDNDWIIGGSGNDTLAGGAGDDTIDDRLGGVANITAGTGDDTITLDRVGSQIDVSISGVIDGGDGNDELAFDGNGQPISVQLSTVTIQSVEILSTFGETIAATAAQFESFDIIRHSAALPAGALTLVLSSAGTVDLTDEVASGVSINFTGSSGADAITLSDGNDTLTGGAGADVLNGGVGIDTATYTGSSAGVTMNIGGVGSGGDAAGDTLSGIENLIGSSFNDTLGGDAGNNSLAGAGGDDTLSGNDGNDILTGGAGADALDGGFGIDTVSYAGSTAVNVNLATGVASGGEANGDTFAGIENIAGSAFNDTLTGNASDNRLDGGGGDDLLIGGGGVDFFVGGTGSDTVSYAAAAAGVGVFLSSPGLNAGEAAGDAYDSINGLIGTAFNDTLSGAFFAYGGAGDDVLTGGFMEGGDGADTMTGTGTSELSYANSAAIFISLLTGQALGSHAQGDTFTGVANVTGSGLGDQIIGNNNANLLSGGGGSDSLSGAGGNDQLLGGDGNDSLDGGAGNDTVNGGAGDDVIRVNFGDGVDTVIGGDGTDRVVTLGNAGGETLDIIWNGSSITAFKGGAVTSVEQAEAEMGGGVDWLRHHNSTVGVSINLAAGTATGFVSIANIENAWGSAFNDTLTGSGVANIIRGGAGADTIDGGGDNDTLVGDDGNDTILGGDGADSIYGLNGVDTIAAGDGADIIYYSFGEGIDAINGGDGIDTIICQGNSGAESLDVSWDGSSFTFFKGGAVVSIELATLDMGLGGDWLRYNGSTVGISINLTTNTATGFTSIASVENIGGGAFNDTLIGSAAANTLLGNDGDDVIEGAGGNDTMTGGAGADTFVFATGSAGDVINDFDADATGGQDLLDISGYGITALDFGARVVITDQGANTLITIDGANTIVLTGVTGDGDNVVTQSDFILGP